VRAGEGYTFMQVDEHDLEREPMIINEVIQRVLLDSQIRIQNG